MRHVLPILLQLSRAMFLAILLTIALYAFAKPDPPKKPKEPPKINLANLSGPSRWGNIQHDGKKQLAIDGHPHWYVADGIVRADGKILVYWILRSDNERVAPGLYDVHPDGSITGKWGWDAYEKDGVWHGLDSRDTLRDAMKVDQ